MLVILFCFLYSNVEVAETFGNLQGAPGDGYYLGIWVGNPPQIMNVLIDTGSSNLAIAGYNNNLTDRYYQYKSSNSYKNTTTRLEVKYTEGEWRGHLAIETVVIPDFANLTVDKAYIAVIESSKKFFVKNANWDGILGLAYKALAKPNSSVTPLADRIASLYNDGDSFAIQLCGTMEYHEDLRKSGGHISFGPPLPLLNVSNFLYTPIVKKDYYQVLITNIQVNGFSLSLDCQEYNNDKTIVDTGTTDFKLPKLVFSELTKLLQKAVHSNYSAFFSGEELLCFSLDMELKDLNFPNISVHLMHDDHSSFSLEIYPQLYLRELRSATKHCYSLAIESSDYGTVIGSVVLQGFYLHFDRLSDRIGFAVSNCSAVYQEWDIINMVDIIPFHLGSKCQYSPKKGTPIYVWIVIAVCSAIALIISLVLAGCFFRSVKRKRAAMENRCDIAFETLYDQE